MAKNQWENKQTNKQTDTSHSFLGIGRFTTEQNRPNTTRALCTLNKPTNYPKRKSWMQTRLSNAIFVAVIKIEATVRYVCTCASFFSFHLTLFCSNCLLLLWRGQRGKEKRSWTVAQWRNAVDVVVVVVVDEDSRGPARGSSFAWRVSAADGGPGTVILHTANGIWSVLP